jgi:hypothetical protein
MNDQAPKKVPSNAMVAAASATAAAVPAVLLLLLTVVVMLLLLMLLILMLTSAGPDNALLHALPSGSAEAEPRTSSCVCIVRKHSDLTADLLFDPGVVARFQINGSPHV